MLVSIIIPCYNSEATIEKVVTMVMDEFSQHDEYDCDFFLVNDYSRDDTFGAITRLAEKYPTVHGINLMRNFGQHNALMAAMTCRRTRPRSSSCSTRCPRVMTSCTANMPRRKTDF